MVLFSCRDARPTVSDGHILLFTFLQAFSFQNALRGRNLAFFLFTGILFSVGPPGAPSFVARRKIGEKGVPRGCGPLNPRGNVLGHSDVLCAYVFAMVRVTRLSRAWRAPHCFHALCVLRPEGEAPASPQEVPLGYAAKGTVMLTILLGTAVRMSPWKQCACHTPRTGLNRVNCTRANS